MASNIDPDVESAKDLPSTTPCPDETTQGGNQELIQMTILEIPPEDQEDFKEWFELASKIRIMVTGATGVGKSTLLNGIIGDPLFEVGEEKKEAVTKHVTVKERQKGDITIVAIDCPGLHDGTDNDDVYLQEMYDAIQAHDGIDLLLYCKDMTETRINAQSDADIIMKLTNKLGKGIWQHSLFVLTFGNLYEKMLKQQKKKDVSGEFKKRKVEWKTEIEAVMRRCDIEYSVKVCATGWKKPELCGKPYWLSGFWAAVFQVQHENSAMALLRLNTSRMVTKASKESFEQELDAQPLVVTNKLKKRLGIAAGIGGVGVVSGLTGAAIGATIGAVLIGVISFGTAAAAGLVLGGVIGAAAGSSIGGAVLALYQRRKAKKLKAAAEKATSKKQGT